MIINEVFDTLSDLPCWNVRWDIDLGISLNFGNPYLEISEPEPVLPANLGTKKDHSHERDIVVKSEWDLWICQANWKISVYNFQTVQKSTDYPIMWKALKRLEGQKIIKTTVQPRTLNTNWDFDLGGKLNVRRKSENNDDLVWMLTCPDHYYLSVSANGTYSYERIVK